MRSLPAALLLLIATIAATGNVNAAQSAEQEQGKAAMVVRGEYLLQAANCYACHTDIENDGAPLAGGRALETDFGTFYSPNITPDMDTGIGDWTDEQFVTALTRGISPQGYHYYPSFPYLSYSAMKRQDALAIKAYLFSQPATMRENRPHELKWYLSRFIMAVWRFFNDAVTGPVGSEETRGGYLVDTLGHCNECHTPRNQLGMLLMDQRLTGNEDLSAPDISNREQGIGDWSRSELADLFRYGELPDGDYVADHMGEVVDYSTSKWSDDDLNAAIDYLLGE